MNCPDCNKEMSKHDPKKRITWFCHGCKNTYSECTDGTLIIEYIECEKMNSIKDKSQICGEFLNFLRSKYSIIDNKEAFENNFIPFGYSSPIDIEKLLAEFFGINLEEVEREKRLILKNLR